MSAVTTAKQMEVMKAYIDGKPIEMRNTRSIPSEWTQVITPTWNWAIMDYRVKAVPREFVVVLDKYGQVVGAAKPNGMVTVNNRSVLPFEDYTTIRVQEVL